MLNIKSIKFVGMGAFIYYNNFFLDGGGGVFNWEVFIWMGRLFNNMTF